jgi:hypothetical protein
MCRRGINASNWPERFSVKRSYILYNLPDHSGVDALPSLCAAAELPKSHSRLLTVCDQNFLAIAAALARIEVSYAQRRAASRKAVQYCIGDD